MRAPAKRRRSMRPGDRRRPGGRSPLACPDGRVTRPLRPRRRPKSFIRSRRRSNRSPRRYAVSTRSLSACARARSRASRRASVHSASPSGAAVAPIPCDKQRMPSTPHRADVLSRAGYAGPCFTPRRNAATSNESATKRRQPRIGIRSPPSSRVCLARRRLARGSAAARYTAGSSPSRAPPRTRTALSARSPCARRSPSPCACATDRARPRDDAVPHPAACGGRRAARGHGRRRGPPGFARGSTPVRTRRERRKCGTPAAPCWNGCRSPPSDSGNPRPCSQRLGLADQVLERPRRSSCQTTSVWPARRCSRALHRAARRILEDALAPLGAQRVALQVERLVLGGDAGVADQQGFRPDCPENGSSRTIIPGQGFRIRAVDPPGCTRSRASDAPDRPEPPLVGQPHGPGHPVLPDTRRVPSVLLFRRRDTPPLRCS